MLELVDVLYRLCSFFSPSSQPPNGNALERHILRPSLQSSVFRLSLSRSLLGPDSCIAIKWNFITAAAKKDTTTKTLPKFQIKKKIKKQNKTHTKTRKNRASERETDTKVVTASENSKKKKKKKQKRTENMRQRSRKINEISFEGLGQGSGVQVLISHFRLPPQVRCLSLSF